MTEKIELTKEELIKIIAIATNDVKHFVMDSENFVNEQLEAINLSSCCKSDSELLKKDNIPTFEEWKKNNLLDSNCYGDSYKHKLGWRTKQQLIDMYQKQYFF